MVGAEERGDHLHTVVPRPGVPHQSSGWNAAAGSGWTVHKPAVSGAHAQNTHKFTGYGQHHAHCVLFSVVEMSHPPISFWLSRSSFDCHVLFQVINGQLVFAVTRGATRLVRLRLDQVHVADGRWHDLQLELRDVRSGRETRYVATLRLDFGLYQVNLMLKKIEEK